jgi:hypothetical protein
VDLLLVQDRHTATYWCAYLILNVKLNRKYECTLIRLKRKQFALSSIEFIENLSLIIWITVFSQPLLRPTWLAKKKKTRKKFLKYLLSEPQRVFSLLDDISRARWNIVKMMISRSRDVSCDGCVTFTWHSYNKNWKNWKIEKNEKTCFF